MLVERWRSQEDLDAHFATAHVQELLAFAGQEGILAERRRMTFTTPLRLGTPGKGALQGDGT